MFGDTNGTRCNSFLTHWEWTHWTLFVVSQEFLRLQSAITIFFFNVCRNAIFFSFSYDVFVSSSCFIWYPVWYLVAYLGWHNVGTPTSIQKIILKPAYSLHVLCKCMATWFISHNHHIRAPFILLFYTSRLPRCNHHHRQTNTWMAGACAHFTFNSISIPF